MTIEQFSDENFLQDLAVATIEEADKKTVEDIAEVLAEKASRIKSNKGKN